MILFRADGNSQIGSGHVMRCIALAKALRKQGERCLFVAADHAMQMMIERHGFCMVNLHGKWDDLEQEEKQLMEVIGQVQPRGMIVDSYYVTKKYFEHLKGKVKTAYIDDLLSFDYPCDIFINYHPFAEHCDYQVKANQIALLGCKYIPLRQEFAANGVRINHGQVSNIFLSTGGADPLMVAPVIVQQIVQNEQFVNIDFHLIVGSLNPGKDELIMLAEHTPNLVLYENIEHMADLMRCCELAISASGSTLYELCACGVPTVAYAFADNQLGIMDSLAKEEVIFAAGDWRKNRDEVVRNIRTFILNLQRNEITYIAMQKRQQALVDGNGAERLAKQMITIFGQ